MPDLLQALLGRLLPGEAHGGIARRQLEEDHEGDQQHDADDQDRPAEPACDVDQHRVDVSSGAPRGAPESHGLLRYCTARCA